MTERFAASPHAQRARRNVRTLRRGRNRRSLGVYVPGRNRVTHAPISRVLASRASAPFPIASRAPL